MNTTDSPAFEARYLIDIGRPAAALDLIGERLADEPDDVGLHLLAAEAATDEEMYAEAEEHLAFVLSVDPEDYAARLMLAELCIETRELARAELLFIELIREDPDDAYLLSSYAYVMLLALELDKARALATESLRVDPDQVHGMLVATLVDVIDRRREGAHERIQQLIHDYPEAEELAWVLLVILADEKRFKELLPLAQGLLRENPDNEDLREVIIAAKVASHWLLWPYYPLVKFGYAGAAATWVAGMAVILAAQSYASEQTAFIVVVAVAVYFLSSWVIEPGLSRWYEYRGVR